MRTPVYQYVVTQNFRAFRLAKTARYGAYYRPCRFSTLFADTTATWRSVLPFETMVEFEPGLYRVVHVSVDACHCEWCGADVGRPCKNKRGVERGPVHFSRKRLFRKTLRDAN